MSNCKDCKYRIDDECHRYPPIGGYREDGVLIVAFPIVKEDTQCGEFSQILDPDTILSEKEILDKYEAMKQTGKV